MQQDVDGPQLQAAGPAGAAVALQRQMHVEMVWLAVSIERGSAGAQSSTHEQRKGDAQASSQEAYAAAM